MKLATPEEKQRRLDICAACPFREQRLHFFVCNKCGCILSAKTSLQGASCPLNKW